MSVFYQLGCALPYADGFRERYGDSQVRELGFHLTFNGGKWAVDFVQQDCLLNQRKTNPDSMMLFGPACLP